MESFVQMLTRARSITSTLKRNTKLHFVIGNESCDLDSTVSALALSYLINSKNTQNPDDRIIIPLMNVKKKYFHLRTEIIYLLKQCQIDPNSLLFKDELDLCHILHHHEVTVSLVDHHVLATDDRILSNFVTEIFDHRPENSVDICKNDKLVKNISPVGSCVTLITKEILDYNSKIIFKELHYLLYATIIYDTLGLEMSLGRTTREDLDIAERLEQLYQTCQSRKDLFSTLWTVHNDTSGLPPGDLLYRDLKIAQGIPIPGLPMLAQNYVQSEGITQILENFAKEYNTKVVLLIGIDASSQVRRDMAIYYTDDKVKDTLVEALINTDLELEPVESHTSHVICYEQKNVKLTRKFILPLVNQAANKLLQPL